MATQPSDLDEWMTVKEAAKLLSWGEDTLWKIIRAGEIDVIRIGAGQQRKQTRITRRAVVDYVDRNTERAKPNRRKA